MELMKNNEGFNNDLTFDVSENPSGISKLRLFGDKLLHLEFQTDYGKKEIVCDNGNGILNHVMLKNKLHDNALERFSVFAAYEITSDGLVNVKLKDENDSFSQIWTVDVKAGVLSASSSDALSIFDSLSFSAAEAE